MLHISVIVHPSSHKHQVPPIPYNYEENMEVAIMKWDVRTVSLTIDIRRDPKGEKWLLQRAVMHEELNGRYDIDIKIINPNGEIVAIVHQVIVSVPRARPAKKGKERIGMPSL
jgi:acyl-CoA thioesterase